MELKKGYKKTEVGVIPSDWEVKELNELCYPSSSRLNPITSQENFKCIELEHLSQGSGKLLGYADSKDLLSQKSIFKNGDVLFGKLRPYLRKYFLANFDGLCTSEIWVLKTINGTFNEFLFQLVQSDKVIEAANISTGTKMPRAEWKTVSETKIAVPPRTEQTLIATALSDADALITSLEKLIAKKRNIKQGAMQQLLKPKKGWVVKRLGNVSDLITKGTTPTSLGKVFVKSGINFIKIESLEENGTIIKDKVAFIDYQTHQLLKRSQLKENDVLISIAGALGRIAIVKKEILPANTNQALAIVRLRNDSEIDRNYLFYFLNTEEIKNHIASINVQAAQANLSLLNISDFLIPHPSMGEQKEISGILSDMDSEVNTLEEKLIKSIYLKQGMMQNLLTGKIRLV